VADSRSVVPAERIEKQLILLREHKVMLDSDLADLYEVDVKALNQAVKRNMERFPADFMFQLTVEETELSRSQIVTSKASEEHSRPGRGGRRYLPYGFTEQGVAMLSSVLGSRRAVQGNIEIMRSFVRLREMLASNRDLARRLDALEKRYDAQFKAVFDAHPPAYGSAGCQQTSTWVSH
jgi:hypothetical protein